MNSADKLRLLLEAAVAAHQNGDLVAAEQSYRRILKIKPRQFDALHLLGMVEFAKGRLSEADRRVTDALKVNPTSAQAFANRSAIRLARNDPNRALADADRATGLEPKFAAAHTNRANALLALGRAQEASETYDIALRLDPGNPEAWSSKAAALLRLRRLVEARNCAERAAQLNPALSNAWANLGLARQELDDQDGAAEAYERALILNPNNPDALYNRGILRHALGDFSRALDDLITASQYKRFDGDEGQILQTKMSLCDWEGVEAARMKLAEHIEQGGQGGLVTVPFSTMYLFDNPRLTKIAARALAAHRYPLQFPGLSERPIERSPLKQVQRLHVAYLSADFRDHPVSYLLIDCLERRDKRRFALTGIAIGPRDFGAMAKRVQSAFDDFIDARGMSDSEAARMVAEARVDLLVDLTGHTGHSRPGIFAWRPAPVQVNFLGYPGTMGAPYYDYLIADKVVAPDPADFDEAICYLPDTYQPTSLLPSIERSPTRADAGLPEAGFVFSSFCNNWKITPDVFAAWMRLLAKIEGSVLWLLANNDDVSNNLIRAASQAGVAPERIVFAPRVGHAAHIARQSLADIALDTFPYGAHTTASDAVRVGLPLVALSGRSFYSRVSRSILRAAGLEAFATDTLEAYETLALELASNPSRMAEARRAFADAANSPLFDTDRYTRNLEAGFEQMIARSRAGLAAETFVVPAFRASD